MRFVSDDDRRATDVYGTIKITTLECPPGTMTAECEANGQWSHHTWNEGKKRWDEDFDYIPE
jgi:hypothetical protein